MYTSESFVINSMDILGRKTSCIKSIERRFLSTFGVSPQIAVVLWNKIVIPLTNENKNIRIKHLLWMLMFFKLYAADEVLATLAGTTDKTFRKWVWILIDEFNNNYDKQVK